MRQDIINDYQVLSSRNITEEEYNTIISLLDKYKMNKDNFIKNSKSLVLKETTYPKQIYNGYYPKDNIVVYNKNLKRDRKKLVLWHETGHNVAHRDHNINSITKNISISISLQSVFL